MSAGWWYCNVCDAQNSQYDGECQFCDCDGAACKRDNCSGPCCDACPSGEHVRRDLCRCDATPLEAQQ